MNIEFIEPRFPSRRVWLMSAAPFMLALTLWGTKAFIHAQLGKQLAVAQLVSKASPLAPIVRGSGLSYQAKAQEIANRATLPEADALAELEHVEIAGIQLRSIDLNADRAVVVVELDAANEAPLEDYIDQLNAGGGPPRWHIQRLRVRTGDVRSSAGTASAGTEITQVHSVVLIRGLL